MPLFPGQSSLTSRCTVSFTPHCSSTLKLLCLSNQPINRVSPRLRVCVVSRGYTAFVCSGARRRGAPAVLVRWQTCSHPSARPQPDGSRM
ncbi:hypothetical protein JZ751_016588 [Albula glossodonta]|uniref:Uncharacterized protein n=1 Tax=Albula glossodonta TaxID=121402 RepID=A0A8T2MWF9_9TELE|nr:hypothetical protein JZ751_016588 [Albula glossodonta]